MQDDPIALGYLNSFLGQSHSIHREQKILSKAKKYGMMGKEHNSGYKL